jgi:hypothetical protein
MDIPKKFYYQFCEKNGIKISLSTTRDEVEKLIARFVYYSQNNEPDEKFGCFGFWDGEIDCQGCLFHENCRMVAVGGLPRQKARKFISKRLNEFMEEKSKQIFME